MAAWPVRSKIRSITESDVTKDHFGARGWRWLDGPSVRGVFQGMVNAIVVILARISHRRPWSGCGARTLACRVGTPAGALPRRPVHTLAGVPGRVSSRHAGARAPRHLATREKCGLVVHIIAYQPGQVNRGGRCCKPQPRDLWRGSRYWIANVTWLEGCPSTVSCRTIVPGAKEASALGNWRFT